MSSHKVFVNKMHSSILLKQLAAMWRREVMCDAVIIHDHGTVKVHKVILTAACGSSLGTDQELTIQAPPGVKKESLLDALTFLYDGVLTLTNENFSDIWKIASALKIEELRKCCFKFAECYKQDFRIDLIPVTEHADSAVNSYSVSDELMSHIVIVDVTRLSQPKLEPCSSVSQESDQGVESREGQSSPCTTFELQDDFSLKAIAEARELSFMPNTLVESDDFAMDEPESDEHSQILTPFNTADTQLSTEVKQEPPDSYQQSSSELEDLSCEPLAHIPSAAATAIRSNSPQESVKESGVADNGKEDCVKKKARVCLDTTPKGLHFKCTLCNLPFANRDCLKRHNKKHEGKLVPCIWTSCTKKFYSSYEMKEHVHTLHMGKKYSCEQDGCDKTFSSKQGIKRHQNEHKGVFRHICQICGKGFSYLRQFNEHVNKHHDIRPHKCTKCSATFACESSFTFHVSVCGNEPEVECDICGKYFKAKKYMMEHRHVHTSPAVKHQCDLCGKCYTHRGGLKKHITRKH